MRKIATTILAGAGLAMLCASTVLAQGRIVTFGDSLSDPGNLFAVTGGLQPPSPPYANGRFSNGPTWIEQITGAPVTFVQPLSNTASVNYAFGGARTDMKDVLNPPGIPAQIAAYLSRGGTFAAQDRVTLWGGANNILQELQRAQTGGIVTQATITAVAQAAASDIANAAKTAAAAGARQFIVLNLPDLGQTPAFLATAGQGGATLASVTFNSALAAQLAALKAANPGLNIVMVDTAALFAQLTSNPGAFGFSNVTQACIATPACLLATRAAQNAFAFYDPIHPTAGGHALVALLVQTYLNAGQAAGWAAPMVDAQWAQREDMAQRALSRQDQIALGLEARDSYYAEVIGSALQQGGGAGSSFSARGGGLSAGMTRGLGNWTLGGALSGQTGRYSAQGAAGDLTNIGLDLAAQYAEGMWFGRGAVGVSGGSFNGVKRTTIGGLANSAGADTYAMSAIAEAGLWARFDTFALSPRARFGWLGAHIGGFAETGDIAPLQFASRDAGTWLAAGELLAAYTLSSGPRGPFVLQASVGYESWFGATGYGVDAILASNFGTALTVPATSPKGPGFIYGVGLAGPIGESLKLSFDVRGSVGENGRHGELARLALTGAF